MKNPTKGLGEVITGVQDAGQMTHEDFFLGAPFLDGKVLDFDMTSAWRRAVLIDHVEGCLVVDVEDTGLRAKCLEFLEDGPEVLDELGTYDSGVELGFGRARGNDRLHAALPGNGSATEENDEPGDRASCLEICAMGGVEETNKFMAIDGREGWQFGVSLDEFEWNER